MEANIQGVPTPKRLYQTNETNGHRHLISDAASGFTDAAEDGHRHRPNVPSCTTCRKIRKAVSGLTEKYVGVQLFSTDWVRGHLHYFDSAAVDND